MSELSQRPRREKPPADWDLVLKRNPVERLKQEKAPLGIRDELPALIAQGYENVAEEDIVRLQWWGLYHDKPKIGTFMLRVKVPSGILPPREAARDRRGLEPLRQGRRRALDAPEHPAPLARAREAAGRLRRTSTRAGHHDRRRLRRHRAQHHRLPRRRASPPTSSSTRPTVVDAAADLFYGNPDWANLPRKHKYSIAALRRPLQRAGDQLHLADRHRQRRPRGLRRPRRRRPLVGAADRARHGRLRPEGGGERDPRRDHDRLVGGPQATASRA